MLLLKAALAKISCHPTSLTIRFDKIPASAQNRPSPPFAPGRCGVQADFYSICNLKALLFFHAPETRGIPISSR
jgi:hypothetical protein